MGAKTLHHEGHEEHEVNNSKILRSESFVFFVRFVVKDTVLFNIHGGIYGG